ncbi:MAG: ribosome-associated translation inhibitor RaiA [Candidatus Uhrbacteria bacterium]|nr:ribosome-associated translation inhibitor RaiA [Candidatus Uhrbacteria bacterium]
MRITELTGSYIEITDAIRGYVEKKLEGIEKICAGYSPCDVRAEVGKTGEHHNKGKIWRAEFTLTIPGARLRAESTQEDLYAAIDEAKDDLKRQLVSHKERQLAR